MRAANRLSVRWTLPPGADSLDTSRFIADGRALSLDAPAYVPKGANGPGTLYTVERVGDAAGALDRLSAKQLDATYTLPYVSHACMEVLNCAVDFVPGQRCDIYVPTQVAKSVLTLAVNMTGLSGSQVTVHTTFLGGGLGRKAEVDFVGQALQVGMALKRPVLLVWPREEDFSHDQYRPMAVVRARAGLDAAGNITAWVYRNVSPSIAAQRGSSLGALGDGQGTEGAQGLPYACGSRLVEWVAHPAPIPVGYWRSVGASINTFVVESMIDELAAAAGQDPLQFRRGILTHPRWLGVLEAAAQLANWNAPPARGSARGIAVGTAFNSIVATVVEVSGNAKSFRVNRVSVALDSYLVVNPANVQAQLSGGVVHGLNAALYGQQTFTNGAADRKNFNVNRMIRLQEMPEVNVILVPSPAVPDRKVAIGGVGELGVPTLAPALANAFFRLTGQRVRSLPFHPDAKMSGL
jgi:isoquinoline 1-oxidoreductase beta subunit